MTEQRKLVAFGKSSFIISLPKKWINENNLKKGDHIVVEEGETDLILRTSQKEKQETQRKTIIDTKEKNLASIRAEIVGAYLNGVDIIEILSNDLETRLPEIKEILRNLSGLEIMEQTSTKMIAKDILNPKEVEIHSIIRRMDVIVRSMIDDTHRCLQEKNKLKKETIVGNIRQRDEDINRLYFLSNRVIKNALSHPAFARTLQMSAWQLHSAASVILLLEKIADRQKRIAKLSMVSKLLPKYSAELILIFAEMKEKYYGVMKSYYTNNVSLAFSIEVTNKDRIERCNNLLKKCEDANTARIIENLNGMTTSIKNISRIVIGLQD